MTAEKIQQTISYLSRHEDQGRIIVFYVGQLVVGYAIVIFYWSNEYGGHLLNVDELYVKEAFRGRGVATHFLEYVSAGGCGMVCRLQLEVTPTNERAAAFYQRLGFVQARNMTLVKEVQVGKASE